MKILDVSYVQGKSIDWQKVKASGIGGAILRIGYGRELSQKDSTFERNYREATAIGLPVLPYHYSYATTTEQAVKEAHTFLQWAEGREFARKLVFYDLEESDQASLPQTKIRALMDAYADELQKEGWEVGVYSCLSILDKIGVDWLDKNYKVWVAQYADNCDYTGKKVIWQYTSKGNISGVSGNVDVNECYDSFIFKSTDQEEKTVAALKNPNPKSSKVKTVSYKKYGDAKLTEHFKMHEFRCSDGSDSIKFDWYVVNALEAARQFFGKPLNITSAYRTESYNQKIGGAFGSYHTKGRAVDCYISGQSPSLLAKFFQAYGMKGVGCYYDDLFVHVDSRTTAFYWKNQSCTRVSTHLPTLKAGSSGQDTKDLQTALNLQGAKLTVDGIFGSGTNREVRNFQAAKGLVVDGIVGPKTWAALFQK